MSNLSAAKMDEIRATHDPVVAEMSRFGTRDKQFIFWAAEILKLLAEENGCLDPAFQAALEDTSLPWGHFMDWWKSLKVEHEVELTPRVTVDRVAGEESRKFYGLAVDLAGDPGHSERKLVGWRFEFGSLEIKAHRVILEGCSIRQSRFECHAEKVILENVSFKGSEIGITATDQLDWTGGSATECDPVRVNCDMGEIKNVNLYGSRIREIACRNTVMSECNFGYARFIGTGSLGKDQGTLIQNCTREHLVTVSAEFPFPKPWTPRTAILPSDSGVLLRDEDEEAFSPRLVIRWPVERTRRWSQLAWLATAPVVPIATVTLALLSAYVGIAKWWAAVVGSNVADFVERVGPDHISNLIPRSLPIPYATLGQLVSVALLLVAVYLFRRHPRVNIEFSEAEWFKIRSKSLLEYRALDLSMPVRRFCVTGLTSCALAITAWFAIRNLLGVAWYLWAHELE